MTNTKCSLHQKGHDIVASLIYECGCLRNITALYSCAALCVETGYILGVYLKEGVVNAVCVPRDHIKKPSDRCHFNSSPFACFPFRDIVIILLLFSGSRCISWVTNRFLCKTNSLQSQCKLTMTRWWSHRNTTITIHESRPSHTSYSPICSPCRGPVLATKQGPHVQQRAPELFMKDGWLRGGPRGSQFKTHTICS